MTSSEPANKPIAVPPVQAPSLGDSALVHSSMLVPGMVSPVETGPQVPPGLSGSPTMSNLMQALRRRWPLAVGLAVVAATLAVIGVLTLLPAKYAPQVLLHVASRGDVKVWESNDETDFTLYKASMAALIKNRIVHLSALNQKTSTGKDVKDLPLVRDNGVEWLEYALKTDFLLGPEILKVVLNADQPDEGTELLNAIAKAFVEDNFQKENERREKRIKDFKDNQSKMEAELASKRQSLRSREKATNAPDDKFAAAQLGAMTLQHNEAAKAITFNRTEQIKTREQLAGVSERLKKLDQVVVTPERIEETFRKDPRGQTLFAEQEKVEKQILDTKAAGKGPLVDKQLKNLELKKGDVAKQLAALKEELRPEFEKTVRNKIGDEMQTQVVKLQDDLNALEKQLPFLEQERSKIEEDMKKLAPNNQKSLEIISLETKIANLETSVSDVSRTIQKMNAEVVNPRVSILQLATEPKGKDYTKQAKVAGAGGLGMFIMVLFGVAFLEFRSRKISGADDVSRGLGLNVVGSLPPMPASVRKAGAGDATPENAAWQHQLTESVDGIRTMLMHASRSDNLRVIMVTSATGGEGKTSLATQLAASLARAWRKTLLIDGDLRKPSANKVFDLPNEPGFCEVLRNEVSVADAIKPTSLGRLWLLPAGHFDSHAVQALAQDNMRTLLEQLKQQYDFIIVDSCPVLPVADALLLGQHMDGVIFSVLRDVSRVPAVYAAQQKINNLAIRTLGAVMIGAKTEMGNLGYAYSGS